MARIVISPEVGTALRLGRPVVALESAAITSGLPREPSGRPAGVDFPGWRSDQPVHLECALLLHRIVVEGGAAPAMVAVIEGDLCIGLSHEQIAALAAEPGAGKVSAGGLAAAMAGGRTAGTTVSATLAACDRIGPIRVFATGGIGGVHRNWQTLPDVSGDLDALASTQTCVVSAGAKSILDLAATLQRLESLNVPVIGYRSDHFARFYAPPAPSLPLAQRADDAATIARLCLAHWRTLGRPGGVLVSNPVPSEHALDGSVVDAAIQIADEAARAQGVTGAALTPFLLAEVNRLTDGRSVASNLALLVNNARLGGEIATALSAAAVR